MIANDWIISRNTQERKLMIRRAQTARVIVACSYCIMSITYAFIIVLPCFGKSVRLTTNITNPGRLLPLPLSYMYDVTSRPLYELTYISQAIYTLFAMMTYSGIDNFLGLLVFHICGQLDILKNRLAHLQTYKNIQNMLKNCLANHIRLLRFRIFYVIFIL